MSCFCSLLPAPLHVGVAKLCIKNRTSLVTASYVSPEMNALHAQAQEAGIVLLNELGLVSAHRSPSRRNASLTSALQDPGIDHASAMKLIEDARESGNEVSAVWGHTLAFRLIHRLKDHLVRLVLWRAAESRAEQRPSRLQVLVSVPFYPSGISSNPSLPHSWSPRGVLTAALNDARFRLNSRDISIPGAKLLSQNFTNVPIVKGFAFEGVANRNSLGYLKEYGLPDDLPTILRGSEWSALFAVVVAS